MLLLLKGVLSKYEVRGRFVDVEFCVGDVVKVLTLFIVTEKL